MHNTFKNELTEYFLEKTLHINVITLLCCYSRLKRTKLRNNVFKIFIWEGIKVGYTVGNLVLRRCVSGAVNVIFDRISK